jgi:hypothetical protein
MAPVEPGTEETTQFAGGVLDLVVGDLDLDGDPDLYASQDVRSLAAYNVTNGGSPLAFQRITNQGLPANRAVLADFDGDGDPDVVAIPRSGSDAVVVAENRRGQFGSSVGYASAQPHRRHDRRTRGADGGAPRSPR